MRDVFACPAAPDEVAERYCLGRLPAEAAEAFEDHYIFCHSCTRLVETTQEFIDGFRLYFDRLAHQPATRKEVLSARRLH